MKRLIIVGSPRVEGRSGALADLLFESFIEECPEDEVFLAPVSTLEVAGCNACDWCKRGSAVLPNGGTNCRYKAVQHGILALRLHLA